MPGIADAGVSLLLCDRRCSPGGSQEPGCIRKARKGEPGSGGLLD